MAGLTGRLRADDARIADTVLDALADACRDHANRAGTPDRRTHQQRRADALTSILNAIHHQTPIPKIPCPAGTPRRPVPPSRRAEARPPSADQNGDNAQLPHQTTRPPSHHGTAPDPARSITPVPGLGNFSSSGPGSPLSSGPGGLPASEPDRVLAWWQPPPLPARPGRRPHLVVTVSATTLLGIDDLPGKLQGYGVIPADLVRELASQAGKITLLPDTPAHGPGDQSNCTETSRRYRPRRSTTDKVVTRFQECVHPGCPRSAARCDLDHVVPFGRGGRTCECNLVPQCRFHHRLKTHGGWRLRLTRPDEPYPTGTIEWKSRLGRRHIEPPSLHSGRPRTSATPAEPLIPAAPITRAPDVPVNPEDTMDPATRARRREREWSRMTRLLEPPSPPAVPDPGEPTF